VFFSNPAFNISPASSPNGLHDKSKNIIFGLNCNKSDSLMVDWHPK